MDCGWKIHNKFLVYIKSFLEAVNVDEIIEINTKISKFLITTEVSCITCLIISFSDSPWFPPIVAIKRLSPITLSYAFHQLQSPPLEPNIHLYIVYTAPQEKIIMFFFSSLCSVLSSLAETDSIHYSSYHNLLPSHNEYKTYAGRKNKIINGALPPVRAFYQPKVLSSFSGSFSTNTHKDQYKYIQYEKNRITACFSELWSHTHITQISGMTEPYYYIHES